MSGPGRGPAPHGLGARLRALLPAGLRARLPGAGAPGRRPEDRPGDAPPGMGPPGTEQPDGAPDDRPPFVVPDDVWNRPRGSNRPGPWRALGALRPGSLRPGPPRPNPQRPGQGGADPGRSGPGRDAPRGRPGPAAPGRGSASLGPSSLGSVARALWRLGRGHADGLDGFNVTVAGFLASLLPLLLLALLMAAGGAPDAARGLAGAVVGLLAPPVLSHALAARWGREREWLRYAVAVNWCQWALPMLFAVLLLLAQLATGGGAGAALAVRVAVLGLIAYWLWLDWFIARHALRIPGGRAALLVFVVSLGSGALVVLPQLASALLTRG